MWHTIGNSESYVSSSWRTMYSYTIVCDSGLCFGGVSRLRLGSHEPRRAVEMYNGLTLEERRQSKLILNSAIDSNFMITN
jgi:hypothetical protein